MGNQISYGQYTAEVDNHGYLVLIPHTHHMVHDGVLFVMTDVQTTSASGAYLIKTPPLSSSGSAYTHLVINVNTDKAMRISFHEDTTHSVDGASVEIINVNRRYASIKPLPLTRVWRGPTYSDPGTMLYIEKFGGTGASPNARVPEKGRINAEWILKADTYYLLKILVDGADTTYSLELEFYEDKEKPNK